MLLMTEASGLRAMSMPPQATWLLHRPAAVLGALLLLSGPCLAEQRNTPSRPVLRVSPQERQQAIRAARVWEPFDPTGVDVVQGPKAAQGRSFRFAETLRCTFVDPDQLPQPLGGMTQKFLCRSEDGSVLKVSYDLNNHEIFAEVAASRLHWILGFNVHTTTSVRVECKNCPGDPWAWYSLTPAERQRYRTGQPSPERPPTSAWNHHFTPGLQVFIPATVETPSPGVPIETAQQQGWSFAELALLNQQNRQLAATQKQQRDALILLNSMLQNADTKPENQQLVCLDPGAQNSRPEPCQNSVLLIDDLGWSFGRGYRLGRPFESSKMRLDHWREAPVWKDRSRCVTGIQPALDGTLRPTRISEAGRQFLLQRFALLSQQQKEDIFRSARVEMQQINAGAPEQWGEPADWARVLDSKFAEIAAVRCPA